MIETCCKKVLLGKHHWTYLLRVKLKNTHPRGRRLRAVGTLIGALLTVRGFCYIAIGVPLLITSITYAATGTGILEVYSVPAGASIYLNNSFVGKTPYSNPRISTGTYQIRAVLSKEYPPQIRQVVIDSLNPQIVRFKFQGGASGTFTGREIEQTIDKFKGNIAFASIPTGASVSINNGEKRTNTPKGFADVEVGRYSVEFRLGQKSIRGNFDVIKDETVKLIADFNRGILINEWQEVENERLAKAEATRQQEERERIERQRREEKEQLEARQQEDKLHREKHRKESDCARVLAFFKELDERVVSSGVLEIPQNPKSGTTETIGGYLLRNPNRRFSSKGELWSLLERRKTYSSFWRNVGTFPFIKQHGTSVVFILDKTRRSFSIYYDYFTGSNITFNGLIISYAVDLEIANILNNWTDKDFKDCLQ